MGAVGGGLWHVLKGMKNSPSGARFRGGIEVCSFSLYFLCVHDLICLSLPAVYPTRGT